MTRDQFEKRLQEMFNEATAAGRRKVDIVARELHRGLGYPAAKGANTMRFPVVCSVMRSHRRTGDTVLHETPSGTSSTFAIRYVLPRPYRR